MAKRRGFFAELAYQKQQAESRRRKESEAAFRAHEAAVREHERLQRQAERAQRAAVVADAREKARLEKEAALLHAEAQVAEADARNAALAKMYDDIDGILATTLQTDDYVDLESLKVTAEHPPFDPGPVGLPTEPMPELVYPPAPVYVEPPAPNGLIGAKKKHVELIARAWSAHEQAMMQWNANNVNIYNAYVAEAERRTEVERKRLETLVALEAHYKLECDQREAEAAARNSELAKLINELAFDIESAIQDYIGIVLSNSVYPECFPVDHQYRFDLTTRELALTVTVPPPSAVSGVKEYRYLKAKDEITQSDLPLKVQKDRYSSAVTQVAVRSLHEIFEADRGGKIHSISLTVGANAISPATGLPDMVPFVVVAADRAQFSQFDLANVIPRATLDHLGAALSKSPFDLTPADTSRGVRVRKQ